MRMLGLLLLCVLAAYCADSRFYGGVYSDTVLAVTRHVAHGVFVGLVGHI
jgi:hypothetical protein